MAKLDFYSLDRITKTAPNAKYYVIFGKRTNGKTFSVKERALDEYLEKGAQLAVLRRWDTDFQGNNGVTWLDDIVMNPYKGNMLKKKSKGRWNSYSWKKRAWYLKRIDEETGETLEEDPRPFGFAYALNQEEHAKGIVLPMAKNILFDEFITRKYYLPDEFISFQNLCSSIIRKQTDVRIYMCANTISKYCPYFEEMGLSNIKKQEKGTIDIYTYGDSGLIVAVEYTKDGGERSKENNSYFAFNNPKLKMITDGDWELDIYPHMPIRDIKPKEYLYTYFIDFKGDLLQCEIIGRDDDMFTYIHRKTTPLQEKDGDIIFQDDVDYRSNRRRNLLKASDKIGKRIASFFALDKVFYQDNEVGDIVNNYLQWCKVN